MSNLPDEKKEKLIEQVADTVKRELGKQYDNLRKHEVSHDDAAEVVGGGGMTGVVRFLEETEK